ncbi:MAG: aspartate 1-decarboxylase [Actinomycetota bacterium]|nr:aspartate 1-decarboxylase [Actinomycetota bacterium]
MQRTMLGGKVHRATVTGAHIAYEGSITVDADLLDAADILAHESVWVWDVDNGARLQTYAIAGPRGSGVVCINGAAAHLVDVGDLVIIASFVELDDVAARSWKPRVVFVDKRNRIAAMRAERGGPCAGTLHPPTARAGHLTYSDSPRARSAPQPA